jgi:hypothetical protein
MLFGEGRHCCPVAPEQPAVSGNLLLTRDAKLLSRCHIPRISAGLASRGIPSIMTDYGLVRGIRRKEGVQHRRSPDQSGLLTVAKVAVLLHGRYRRSLTHSRVRGFRWRRDDRDDAAPLCPAGQMVEAGETIGGGACQRQSRAVIALRPLPGMPASAGSSLRFGCSH